jgi:hypothetical protein
MKVSLWVVYLAVMVGSLEMPVHAAVELDEIQGSPVLTVLPQDAIPAIDNPKYVAVAEADRFMRPDEPVLGITDGKTAKAYSTWQLNHHEIVNDSLGDLSLAVTW